MTSSSAVIVTGAAGDIGRGLARRFAMDRRAVALLDRTDESLAALADELKALGATSVGVYFADQCDRGAVDAAVAQARSDLGPIGTLVANAGYARLASFLDMPEKVWDRHVDVNLSGTFHTCQSVARVMAEQRAGGSIVVISSCLALYHTDQTGAYNATKAALLMLIRTMAAELGVYRIRANAVLPGIVDTAMTRQTLAEPGRLEAVLADTPLGRIGQTEDVAEAVYFLASEAACFITGASLLVDGGASIYGQPQWVRQDRRTPFEPRWDLEPRVPAGT
ncbi:short-chain dehydrogenase [Mesorhizobium hungaricum]|jgi:NAD(P)-dependent dehydrogenase (short-subunit alcohol dehydrogenase family)|uniref:Short-chain dehydrogenase n=1 Tax=Mesorhizobium hungaricum TaxID=1566387 RepID=A0A1C2E3F1_9HYPH|nr:MULTISPECIES: SDR family NAD(P)-dependent oxidoreductase [Mesorhizobium]MBN9235778.1 SDR family oxidoreductase [Mesorhizobium sp.]MDQ0333128.1 NAD(P)-dependent dehydrogenase (short-subunit alcohol dehydrogenase family) [Mesorhizobium sp. YL-MeA3-2017]OCX21443.1 short-chain dehydrogenase [Mesorhizobium hungaricum]